MIIYNHYTYNLKHNSTILNCLKSITKDNAFGTLEELFEHYIKHSPQNLYLYNIKLSKVSTITLSFICKEDYKYSVVYTIDDNIKKSTTELITIYKCLKRNYNINKLLI